MIGEQIMSVSQQTKRALRLSAVALALIFSAQQANAAQCLVKNVPDQNGQMFQIQAQAKTGTERQTLKEKGFERVNCKELSERQLVETRKMCALVERMTPTVIAQITEELGVSPDAICAMAQDGIKASDAIKADTLSASKK